MADASFIGLGAMGSALARASLRAGHRVTVWNRTTTRAEPLVKDGALLAPDPGAAVVASPIVVVCVDDYAVTRDILSAPELRARLAGRVLVQLSTGTPREARDADQWVRQSGAEYLDGAILAYPDQIGTAEAALLIAGPADAFERCERLLRSLAGGLTYVGAPVGAASALDCAILSFVFGAYLGALHGARICEAEGLRVDEFGAMLAELVPVVGGEVRQLSERIQANRYDKTQAALRIYHAAAARLAIQARDSRIDADFPAYAAGALERGMSAGFGGEDLAALIKVLRGQERPGPS